MPSHAPWASCGSPRWRRLLSAIRGTLVIALILCAVIHGVPEETHGSVPVPTVSSAMVAGGEPHGPHAPHGAEDCVMDVVIRTAAQSIEDLPLAALAVVVLVATSVAAGRPLVRHESRRRRSARTGRVALVRTSRWRI
ncbi:hypothetical protein GCM10009601_04250 [Streptomyces thermospinosisporus]|uniref:Uncharacterized protein n=2 Tax=Streptomyces thermospinosisporus TaxID=161482 RepID=A0ABN1YKZ3_9ACTN